MLWTLYKKPYPEGVIPCPRGWDGSYVDPDWRLEAPPSGYGCRQGDCAKVYTINKDKNV